MSLRNYDFYPEGSQSAVHRASKTLIEKPQNENLENEETDFGRTTAARL